jgi:hypothetical protein
MQIQYFATTLIAAAYKLCRPLLIGCLCLSSGTAGAQFFSYETAYPGVDYASGPLNDRVTRLMADIAAGRKTLEYDAANRGYLDSLLAALEIDPDSQFLVFSKTALKTRFVTAKTPRALYFNDDTYVAFIQNSRSLEIAAMDPVLGPVFFDFSQDPEQVSSEREMNRCLRCHDSYSMTGGGVPRFLLSSVIANPEGEIVTHEISIITDTSTPLNRRWGGMYVSGMHGSQDIMGNFVVDDVAKLLNLDLTPNGNKADLSEYLDTSPYISSGSDIVTLMVLEHQIEVQNRLTRLSFESRTRLHENGSLSADELAELTRPVLESLFFANEVALTDRITGSSGFADNFQDRGPKDNQGRSLRDLNLETRTFEYPLSYLVYSEAIEALPGEVKRYLFDGIRRVLSGELQDDAFSHLDTQTREAIIAILRATKPDILAEGG